jgi:hypothetical protein
MFNIRSLKLNLVILCILFVNNSLFAATATSKNTVNDRGLTFSRAQEFPNLFLPPELRNKPFDKFTSAELKIYIQRKKQVEAAMGAIFDRLQIPFFNEQTKKPEMDYFFSRVEKEIKKAEKKLIEAHSDKYNKTMGARVYPSGGVVRATLSYLYQILYNAEREGKSFDSAIQKILSDKTPIPGSHIRGVGSDFDIYADHLVDENHFKVINNAIRDAVHKIEEHYGLRDSNLEDGVKRSLLTILDVKPIHKIGNVQGQLERSVNGGGANTDWFYYDNQTKQIIMTNYFPNFGQL